MSTLLFSVVGLNLLNTYTPNAAASVDIDSSVITSSYSKYLITFDLMPSTDDVGLSIRTSVDNGVNIDSGGTDYSRTGTGTNSSGTSLTSHSTGASSIIMNSSTAAHGVGNVQPEAGRGIIWILNKGDASNYPTIAYEQSLLDSTSARTARMQGCGHRRNAATINFIQISATTGNITGSVNVYGFI